MIEVILKEHVEHLGERGDVVKVAPGYARNYLLPRKLALAVTAGNKKQIEHEKKVAAIKAAEERAVAQAIATRFAQTEVSFTRRAGENQHLFGSVTSADIAEALAAQGFEIVGVKVPSGRLNPHWFYIPGLLILGFVWLMQGLRMRRTSPAAAAA